MASPRAQSRDKSNAWNYFPWGDQIWLQITSLTFSLPFISLAVTSVGATSFEFFHPFVYTHTKISSFHVFPTACNCLELGFCTRTSHSVSSKNKVFNIDAYGTADKATEWSTNYFLKYHKGGSRSLSGNHYRDLKNVWLWDKWVSKNSLKLSLTYTNNLYNCL